jgi:hypothetical protein
MESAPGVEVHSTTVETATTTTATFVDVGSGFVAYKAVRTETRNGKSGKVEFQGVARADALRRWMSLPKGRPPRADGRVVATREALDAYAWVGWFWGCHPAPLVERTAHPAKAFDAMTSGQGCRVIHLDPGAHLIYELDGTPFPLAQEIDCFHLGGITSETYDIERALEVLGARPDVDLIGPDNAFMAARAGSPVQKAPVSMQRAFHWLRVRWRPEAKTWAKVLEAAAKEGGSTDMVRKAMWDLDVLGLRAGGAARFEGFYDRPQEDDEARERDLGAGM